MLTAASLLTKAQHACNAGRLGEAERRVALAEQRTVDPDLLARLDVVRSYLVAERGDPREGMRILQAAQGRGALAETTRAVIESQRGTLLMRLGDYRAALQALSSPSLHTLEPVELVRNGLNRGLAHLQLGNVVGAGADFEQVVRLGEAEGFPVPAAKGRHNLGYVRLLTGDLVAAMRDMDRARPVLAPLSVASQAIGEQDRAAVLLAAGMPIEAAEVLEASARAFGERRMRQSQGEAELALARTLLDPDPARARIVARRAARRFLARGARSWQLQALAVALGAELLMESHRGKALGQVEDLLTQLREHGLATAAQTLSLQAALACATTGQVALARARLVHTSTTRESIVATLMRRQVTADIALAEGDRRKALRQCALGLDELGAWQASFGSLELQSSTASLGRRLAMMGLRIAVADGGAATALQWSERARALTGRIVPLRPPSDPAAADALTDLRYLLTLEEAERDSALERSLRRKIREHAWYGEGSRRLVAPVSLARLRDTLDARGAAHLAYLVVDDRLSVLVVTRRLARVVDLGPFAPVAGLLAGLLADLDTAATRLSPGLRSAVQGSLDDRLAAIDRLAVRPVLDLVGDRPLVLATATELAPVPWTMLPSLAGHPLTVARSVSTWCAGDEVAGRRCGCEGIGFVSGPHVERADEEIEISAAHWPHAHLLRDPSAQQVSALASTSRVLHIAAHGRHASENPLFSGIQLRDGTWFGYDIDQLACVPALVLLSACSLGRATARWHEEATGMALAWLHAGARCVIASPCAVADEVALSSFDVLHRHLAAGATPAHAVAALAGEGISAPFVCYGDGLAGYRVSDG